MVFLEKLQHFCLTRSEVELEKNVSALVKYEWRKTALFECSDGPAGAVLRDAAAKHQWSPLRTAEASPDPSGCWSI